MTMMVTLVVIACDRYFYLFRTYPSLSCMTWSIPTSLNTSSLMVTWAQIHTGKAKNSWPGSTMKGQRSITSHCIFHDRYHVTSNFIYYWWSKVCENILNKQSHNIVILITWLSIAWQCLILIYVSKCVTDYCMTSIWLSIAWQCLMLIYISKCPTEYCMTSVWLSIAWQCLILIYISKCVTEYCMTSIWPGIAWHVFLIALQSGQRYSGCKWPMG